MFSIVKLEDNPLTMKIHSPKPSFSKRLKELRLKLMLMGLFNDLLIKSFTFNSLILKSKKKGILYLFNIIDFNSLTLISRGTSTLNY